MGEARASETSQQCPLLGLCEGRQKRIVQTDAPVRGAPTPTFDDISRPRNSVSFRFRNDPEDDPRVGNIDPLTAARLLAAVDSLEREFDAALRQTEEELTGVDT